MRFIATEQRAQLAAAAAVLLLIALAPWHRPTAVTTPMTVSIWEAAPGLGTPPVTGPLSIAIPRVDPVPVPNMRSLGSWIHPDMRPWPTGMVMCPPPSGDRNVLAREGVWDRLLSALLAPFRSTSA
jgi:hypothetical protein